MTAARKVFFYGLMWAATALGLLAGIELVLPRLVPVSHVLHHRWGNRPYTLLPGVVHRAATPYYDVTFRANSLGFNDVEHARAKPPGVFRVLLLGDSFVEGFQVDPRRHMARLLEGLAARDGRRLEVVAMGISGWGESHELATYESVGRQFDPDLVVLFFCPNDLWNNLVGVEGAGRGQPVYVPGPAGNLVSTLAGKPETPPTPAELRKFQRKARLPGLGQVARLVRETWRLWADEDVRGAARAVALHELPEAGAAQAPDAPRGIRTDQQVMFEKLVAELKRQIVDRDGHRFLAAIVSGDVRRENDRFYLRMTEWVSRTFARQGVDVLDLDALFRERSRVEHRYPSWPMDFHWNETGHAWVADVLYGRIAPLLQP